MKAGQIRVRGSVKGTERSYRPAGQTVSWRDVGRMAWSDFWRNTVVGWLLILAFVFTLVLAGFAVTWVTDPPQTPAAPTVDR